MNPKLNRKSNGAFTLVEIIGVMAIIGILGAVVAPRVIDGIRESRVTQFAQNMGNWKGATDRYLQKYQKLPVDGSITPLEPDGSQYSDQKSRTVTATDSNFSDILAAQGLIQPVDAPFGTRIGDSSARAATTPNSETDVRRVEGNEFPCIMCVTANANDVFSITRRRDVPFRVAFVRLMSVPTQEAASIKSKIDGPFEGIVGDQTILIAADSGTIASGLTITAQNSEALTRGQCRVRKGGGSSTDLWELSIYLTND